MGDVVIFLLPFQGKYLIIFFVVIDKVLNRTILNIMTIEDIIQNYSVMYSWASTSQFWAVNPKRTTGDAT